MNISHLKKEWQVDLLLHRRWDLETTEPFCTTGEAQIAILGGALDEGPGDFRNGKAGAVFVSKKYGKQDFFGTCV